jgi:hypothetical protein
MRRIALLGGVRATLVLATTAGAGGQPSGSFPSRGRGFEFGPPAFLAAQRAARHALSQGECANGPSPLRA